MDDFSGDLNTTFSVLPYPTVAGEDNNNAPAIPCAASSEPSPPPHIHVRFSHQIVDGVIDEIRALNLEYFRFLIDDIDDDEEYEIESRTLCLSNDLLAEKAGEDCRVFIFSEALCRWPIDAVTALEIADEVVEKARRLRCDLQVDIRSVQ